MHKNENIQKNVGKNRKQIVSGNIKSNASRVLIEYAKNGLGLVRTLENYVIDEIKNGSLKPVLKNDWPDAIPLYLIYRSNPEPPLRVKTFVDFITQFREKLF